MKGTQGYHSSWRYISIGMDNIMTQLIFRDNPDEDVQKVQVKLATYQRQYIHSRQHY